MAILRSGLEVLFGARIFGDDVRVPRPDTEPRKQPTQARSRALVDALVEATEQILQSEGVTGVTTARVAEVAGVSIGSLYQYFPGAEALIAAVIERRIARDSEELRPTVEALATAPLEDVIDGLVDMVCRYYRTETDLYREMVAAMADVDRVQHVRRMEDGFEQVCASLLEPHRAYLADDLEASIFVLRTALLASVREAVADRPNLLTEGRLERRLRALARGVLGFQREG